MNVFVTIAWIIGAAIMARIVGAAIGLWPGLRKGPQPTPAEPMRIAQPVRIADPTLVQTMLTMAGTVDRLSGQILADRDRGNDGEMAAAVVLLTQVARARQPADELGCSRQLMDAVDAAAAYVRRLAGQDSPPPAPDTAPILGLAPFPIDLVPAE